MDRKNRKHRHEDTLEKERTPRSKACNTESTKPQLDSVTIRQARSDPTALRPDEMRQLQNTVGNREVKRLLERPAQSQVDITVQRFCDKKVKTGEELHPDQNFVGMGQYKMRKEAIPPYRLWTSGVATCIAVVVYKDKNNYALTHLSAIEKEPVEQFISDKKAEVKRMRGEVGGGQVTVMPGSATPKESGWKLINELKTIYEATILAPNLSLEVRSNGEINASNH
jgi:hypothetical protein